MALTARAAHYLECQIATTPPCNTCDTSTGCSSLARVSGVAQATFTAATKTAQLIVFYRRAKTYLFTYIHGWGPSPSTKHGSWGFTVEIYIRVNTKELLRVHIKEVLRLLINHVTRLIRISHVKLYSQQTEAHQVSSPTGVGRFKQKMTPP